jgi:hypothetical protein
MISSCEIGLFPFLEGLKLLEAGNQLSIVRLQGLCHSLSGEKLKETIYIRFNCETTARQGTLEIELHL